MSDLGDAQVSGAVRPPGAGPRDQWGSAVATVAVGLGAAVVALLLVVDLAAYLVAAARAQGAADGAALAAVSVSDPRARGGPGPRGDGRPAERGRWTGSTGSPRTVARAVAEAAGASLVSCACRPGAREVTVTVEVDVHTVAVGRVAARRVRATARARLVPAASGRSPSAGPLP